MNRKYILLRRILGISTILLGLLIAILPMFGRAAVFVDVDIWYDDYRYQRPEAIRATLEMEDVYSSRPILYIYSADKSDDDITELSQYCDVIDYAKIGMIMYEQGGVGNTPADVDVEVPDVTFVNCSLTIPDPLWKEKDTPGLKVFGKRKGEKPVSVQYTLNDYYIMMNLTDFDEMDLFVVQSEEETPTDTPTPTTAATPSQTQRPTVTPTPTRIPTNTPTPTTMPVRIPAIDDQRKDRSDTKGISSFIYGGSMPNSILIVRDSDGVGIKRIVVLRKGMILKPWYIRLVDENKRDITDFKSITITLPIPATMNLNKGRVVMVGKRRNGKLQTFDTKIVTKNGFNCAEFTTDYFSDYEYGMLYTPDDGGEDENKLTVSDEREDKEGTEHIDGSVTEGSGKRTLHIADSDGVIILRRIVWKAGMILKPYRIWITDEAGNNVDEFGTLTVTLPLPADMDPEKGVLRVVGSTKDNDTDDFVPEIIKNDDGTYSVRFSTDYFSDNEYGLVYTPFDLEPDVTATPTATGTPTPTIQATATPTLSPTPYSNVTATPTQKAPTKPADVVIVTSTTTPTPKPPTPTEGNGGGDNGGDNGGGGNNGRGRTPIVTPKGGMFYENGLSMNYASTGNTGNGKTGGQTAVKGSGTGAKGSNAKDMPKTGMADVPRMLAVIILITLGCIQLVSTIPVKKD